MFLKPFFKEALGFALVTLSLEIFLPNGIMENWE